MPSVAGQLMQAEVWIIMDVATWWLTKSQHMMLRRSTVVVGMVKSLAPLQDGGGTISEQKLLSLLENPKAPLAELAIFLGGKTRKENILVDSRVGVTLLTSKALEKQTSRNTKGVFVSDHSSFFQLMLTMARCKRTSKRWTWMSQRVQPCSTCSMMEMVRSDSWRISRFGRLKRW